MRPVDFLLWFLLIGLIVVAVVMRVRAMLRRRARIEADDSLRHKTINRILAGGERHHVQGIYERVEPMRKYVERACERIEAAVADLIPDAKAIFENLERGAEPGRLLDFLVAQRNGAQDIVARNREIATLGYLSGDIQTASNAVDAILSSFPTDLDALTRRGTIAYLRGHPDQAKEIYLRVLKLATSNNSEVERAAVHVHLGTLHQLLKLIGDAEYHHAAALKIYEKLKDEAGMADCLVNIGLIHQLRNEHAKAEEAFRKAMEINERLRRLEGLAVTCGCLGLLLYDRRGNLEESERLLGTALDLNSRLGRLGGMASAYGNLGLVRLKRGHTKAARDLFQKSLTLYQKLNRPKLATKVQAWLDQIDGEPDIAPEATAAPKTAPPRPAAS
jgi:tetratricopeptide (TPR) repeat protein